MKPRALAYTLDENDKRKRSYCVWEAMHQRCRTKTHPSFKYYGGRGIKVCERWSGRGTGYVNFLADMGEPPKGLTLDRFPDNDGNYEPGNCRWATRKEQVANRRRQTCWPVKPNSLIQKALRAGLPPAAVSQRINKLGWSEEKALTTPLQKPEQLRDHCAKLRQLYPNKKGGSIQQRAIAAGLPPHVVYFRIYRGWPEELALRLPLGTRIQQQAA